MIDEDDSDMFTKTSDFSRRSGAFHFYNSYRPIRLIAPPPQPGKTPNNDGGFHSGWTCNSLEGCFLMKHRALLGSIDVERVILVPVMTVLLLGAILALFSGGNHASSSALVAALHLSYQVLLTVFYVLLVFFLLTRNPASARSGRIAPTVAAYVGTFLPFLFAFTGGSEVSEGLAFFSVGLMVVGMSFTVYSLFTLGKSFGVEAQVRTLVQHGPYRLIRNPLYVGEMVTLIGAVCFDPTLLKMAILLTLGAVQAYRAVQEERLLEENLPQYAAYKLRTKRFVPGLF